MKPGQHAYLTKLRGEGRMYQGNPVPKVLPDVDVGALETVEVGMVVRAVLTELEAAKELQELEQMADEQRALRLDDEEDNDDA